MYLHFLIVYPNISSNVINYISNENSSVTFECTATGIPAPIITWYRNGVIFNQENDSRVTIAATTDLLDTLLYRVVETLTINTTQDSDSNTYSCRASNDAGIDTAVFQLIVQGISIFF